MITSIIIIFIILIFISILIFIFGYKLRRIKIGKAEIELEKTFTDNELSKSECVDTGNRKVIFTGKQVLKTIYIAAIATFIILCIIYFSAYIVWKIYGNKITNKVVNAVTMELSTNDELKNGITNFLSSHKDIRTVLFKVLDSLAYKLKSESYKLKSEARDINRKDLNPFKRSIIVILLYGEVEGNNLEIVNGDDFWLIISVDTIFEKGVRYTIYLEGKNERTIVLDEKTDKDSVFKSWYVDKISYKKPGIYDIVAIAKSENGAFDTTTLYLKVLQRTPNNTLPNISFSESKFIYHNDIYYNQVIATDADGDKLSYSLISKPKWLSIDPVSGLVLGYTPDLGKRKHYQYVFTVKVSDEKDFVIESYIFNVLRKN